MPKQEESEMEQIVGSGEVLKENSVFLVTNSGQQRFRRNGAGGPVMRFPSVGEDAPIPAALYH